MRAMAAPQEVQDIVAAHAPHFSVVEEDGRVKIKCELNGHTFPARADALEAFVRCAACGDARRLPEPAVDGTLR